MTINNRVSRRRVVQGLGVGAGLIAAPAYIRSGYAATKTIKLGFVSPETGPIAAFGSADEFVLSGVRKLLANGLDYWWQDLPGRDHRQG